VRVAKRSEASLPGDVVLDPFAGTATTSVAASESGRNSIGIEVEPKYVALGARRLRALRNPHSHFSTSRVRGRPTVHGAASGANLKADAAKAGNHDGRRSKLVRGNTKREAGSRTSRAFVIAGHA
jgi:hypothetical protein